MTLQDLQNEIKKRSVFYAKDLAQPIVSMSGGLDGQWIIDLRAVLFDPVILQFVVDQFWKIHQGKKQLQIAGLELASVPMLSGIVLDAHKYGCQANGVVVRKSKKKYGLQKNIEGDLKKGVETVIVDDLVNSGSSVLKCLVSLLEEGISANSIFSIIDYNKTAKKEAFAQKGLEHHFLLLLEQVVTVPAPTPELNLTKYRTQFSFRSNTRLNSHGIFCKSSPLVDGKNVYYGTDEAVFYAINKNNGGLSWKFEAVPNKVLKGIWSSPCLVRNGVCFGSYDGSLYCLERETGKPIWTFAYANIIGSSPCFAENLDLVFIGLEFGFPGKKGSVAAVNATTGQLVWEHDTHLHVHSSPLYSAKNDMVFCGSNDCDMLSLDAKTGALLWRQPIAPGICKMRPTLSAAEDLLFVSGDDSYLRVLESATGRIIWTYKAQFGIIANPLLVEDKVIIGALDNCIHILDAKKGTLIKKIRTDGRIMSHPTYHRGKVYVGNNAGGVFELDMRQMELVGRYQLPDRATSAVAYCEKLERFYVHSNDDRLYAFAIEG